MGNRIDFDVNEYLQQYLSDPAAIPTSEADSALVECENDPQSLTNGTIDAVLNPAVDRVAENADAILEPSIFDSLLFLLKSPSQLPPAALSKILDLLVSTLSTEADVINNESETDEQESMQQYKPVLEALGFLLQWAIAAVETKASENSTVGPPARGRGGGRGAKTKGGAKESSWDPSQQLQTALNVISKVLKLKLPKIFLTTSERDTFVGLFTRPVYLILESEVRTKSTAIRMHSFKVLCIAIKHHGHAYGAQTSIIQNLTYFEHLAEPMAELLHILAEQYDYPQLAEEVLKELSNKEYNSNDLKGPKSVSAFVTKISELAPRLVIRQMILLAKLLDSESYILRCAIIEVCGNMISMLSKQEGEERSENQKEQINALFDVLEERLLDVNPYCRCRALQVYSKLCDLETKFPKKRQTAAELAARSLEDKSSNVRRNAIKLLGKLTSTHPFSLLHGGQLSLKEWKSRLEAVDAEIKTLKGPAAMAEKQEAHIDDALLADATQVEGQGTAESMTMTEEQKAVSLAKATEEAANAEMLQKLHLTRRYYLEALRFIEVVHEASNSVRQLLSSKNKSEVIEAMDFFVIADAYKVETARSGIRRMLRLIWTKGNSDEGKGVQAHLIECYKGLFFDAPDSFSANDAANYIARNMISLTFGATPAELTSLEQLLSTMTKTGLVSQLVIEKLWQVYGVQKKEISKSQRRGAIVVLGMLALADHTIVVNEMDSMLRIGLGPLGRADLGLAKYTCIALTRINPTSRKAKTSAPTVRLPNDHPALAKLVAAVEIISDSRDWLGVAEQAIGAIYGLAKQPDTLCSEILRRKVREVFQKRSTERETAGSDESGLLSPPPEEPELQRQKPAQALSQLLFIVGHIAIKQIVHLELCEMDFKRRKTEKEKSKVANCSPTKVAPLIKIDHTEDNELDLIGGTTEDDFAEAMAHIRERELLYGEQSLLSNFGTLVTEICSNNITYDDPDLQAAAALCMAKLMCVSSEFCETNLPLLITILERSTDPITRSNLVIALGDMAVCFNHLIDENTDFLYRRLNDSDASVKRTCLMTLTFLILAGQVKVKGQLGEMAKCIEDADKRIADLSRMFFTELATKDNAVYNHFVDMFSLLSADNEVEEDSFRKIFKFLASFIEKDKHAKQLSQKLAARLRGCDNERQWNDVVYALSLLQHKDEEIQKTVTEGFKLVKATA